MPKVTFTWDREAINAMLIAATYKMFNLMDASPVSTAVQFIAEGKEPTGAVVCVNLEPKEKK